MQPTAREQSANANSRALWLQQGLRALRPIPGVTGALGSTVRIKLDPTGLLTGLIIRATCRVDIAGAVQVPANSAPYTLLSRIRLTDSGTNDRIVITGEHAYAIGAWYDRNAGLGQSGLIYSYPKVPVNIGTNQLVDVTFRVPVCGNSRSDLRGAMFMPSESQAYLYCDFLPTLLVVNDDTALYKGTAGTVTLNTSTQQPMIEVWQEFLDAPYPLPQLDVATKHYLTGAQQITSGLVAATEQLIDYPVSRRIKGFFFSQFVDGLENIDNLTQIRTIVRSNYDARRISGIEQFIDQRHTLDGNDLQQGIWFIEHSPEVASAFAREYQVGITPAVTGASQSLTFTFDCFGE